MYNYRALRLSNNKIAKMYEYYKLNLNFSDDISHSYSSSIKKIIEAAKNFCMNVITHNNNSTE